MRFAKILGIAAIAALTAMAFLGASSASAVKLCKNAGTGEEPNVRYPGECPGGESYAEGTAISSQLLAGTKAVLKTSLGNVVCNKSAVTGKTGASTEEKLEGSIEKVTFEECKLGATACTVKVEGLPYKALLLLVPKEQLLDGFGHLHYHLVVHLGKATVVCGAVLSCTFGAKEILFNVHFISVWILKVAQELERQGGLICPSTSFWEAEYEITEPKIGSIAMK
jgi:hypothetical protein